MASVEDRWFVEQKQPDDTVVKVKTARHGVGRRWRAHYRTPDGRQRNKSFDRKQDAERYLTTVEASKLTGTFVDPARGKVTLRSLKPQFFAAKAALGRNTRANYTSVLDTHILPRWGDVPVGRIEHEDLQTWFGELVAGGMSASMLEKVHVTMSSLLDLAVRNRRIPANPARGLERPKVVAPKRRYLTATQVEKMATAAGKFPAGQPKRRGWDSYDQYRVFVLVLAYCGPRWSEAAALRVQSVDVARRRLYFSDAVVEVRGALTWGLPKGDKRRYAPIPPSLIADLEKLCEGRRPEDLLFTSPEGGVLRRGNATRAWFNKAATAAGFPGLVPHELRHTAASLAVSGGANIVAVSKMLGHANPAITLRVYADLFDEDLDAVGDAMDRLRADAGVAPALPAVELHAVEDGS